MEKFEFAIIAQDITEHWNLPDDSTLKDCQKFCLSMFRIGEATYVCSLTPASYVDDMENAFLNPNGAPLSDEQMDELDREGYQYEALDHDYTGYIKPDRVGNDKRIGEICVIELDPADYEDSDEGREAMRRDAWQEAREEMSANSGYYEPAII